MASVYALQNVNQVESQFPENLDLHELLLALFSTGKWSNVEFNVKMPKKKNESIFAHQLILAAVSPVFADIFYSNEIKKARIVDVVTTNGVGFKEMIRCIYQEALPSIEKIALVIKAAQRSKVKFLEDKCRKFILNCTPSSANVLYLLDAANALELKNMRKKCFSLIETNTREVLKNKFPSFLALETVLDVLRRPQLYVNSNADLLLSIIPWIQENNEENTKEIVLSFIDIPSINIEKFLEIAVSYPNFFNDSEFTNIIKNSRQQVSLLKCFSPRIKTVATIDTCSTYTSVKLSLSLGKSLDLEILPYNKMIANVLIFTLKDNFYGQSFDLVKINLAFGPNDIPDTDFFLGIYEYSFNETLLEIPYTTKIRKIKNKETYSLVLQKPIKVEKQKLAITSISFKSYINYSSLKINSFSQINSKAISTSEKDSPLDIELDLASALCFCNYDQIPNYFISSFHFDSCSHNQNHCIKHI